MLIFVLIIVFAIITFIGFFTIKNKAASWVVGVIGFLGLAASVIMLTAHINNDWGMKEVTTTTTQQIYTAGETSAPYGMVIKQELGTDTNNYVFVYRTSADQSKPSAHFVPDESHITEAVKKSATYQLVSSDKAEVKTTTTRRVFSSSLIKNLFDLGGENNELVKQHSVLSIPKDTWLVLTQAQVEKLTKEAPAMQAQMEAELKADPAKAMQLAELQKTNPTEYAAMQVQQIKTLLGIKD